MPQIIFLFLTIRFNTYVKKKNSRSHDPSSFIQLDKFVAFKNFHLSINPITLNHNNNTIVIITARGESKRLPGKNLHPLLGKPLIDYSIQYAFNSGIENCYVSTDSTEIKAQAICSGAKVVNRPFDLATDTTPSVAVLQHAVKEVDFKFGWVVLLQPTNPLRPRDLLKEAMDLIKNTNADSLFTISSHHQKLGTLKDGQFKPYNYEFGQRSQDMQPLYYENGLLYITTLELIKQGLIIGPKHTTLLVEHPYASVDIDTIEDLKYAEFIAKTFETY